MSQRSLKAAQQKPVQVLLLNLRVNISLQRFEILANVKQTSPSVQLVAGVNEPIRSENNVENVEKRFSSSVIKSLQAQTSVRRLPKCSLVITSVCGLLNLK